MQRLSITCVDALKFGSCGKCMNVEKKKRSKTLHEFEYKIENAVLNVKPSNREEGLTTIK
jgi:hypothetical protein